MKRTTLRVTVLIATIGLLFGLFSLLEENNVEVVTVAVGDFYQTVEDLTNDITVKVNGNIVEVVDGKVSSGNATYNVVVTPVSGPRYKVAIVVEGLEIRSATAIVAQWTTAAFEMPNSYDVPSYYLEERTGVQAHTGFITDDGIHITREDIAGTDEFNQKVEANDNANNHYDPSLDQESIEVLPPKPETTPEITPTPETTPTPAPEATPESTPGNGDIIELPPINDDFNWDMEVEDGSWD